jgi:hypothetical protein
MKMAVNDHLGLEKKMFSLKKKKKKKKNRCPFLSANLCLLSNVLEENVRQEQTGQWPMGCEGKRISIWKS